MKIVYAVILDVCIIIFCSKASKSDISNILQFKLFYKKYYIDISQLKCYWKCKKEISNIFSHSMFLKSLNLSILYGSHLSISISLSSFSIIQKISKSTKFILLYLGSFIQYPLQSLFIGFIWHANFGHGLNILFHNLFWIISSFNIIFAFVFWLCYFYYLAHFIK